MLLYSLQECFTQKMTTEITVYNINKAFKKTTQLTLTCKYLQQTQQQQHC